MSSLLDSLTENRAALVNQLTEMAAEASKSSRSLNVDEAAKFESITAEVEAIDKRRQAIVEGEQRAADIEASFKPKGAEPEAPSNERSLADWARDSRAGDSYTVKALQGVPNEVIRRFRSGESRAMAYGAASGLGKKGVYDQLWEYAVEGSQILQAGVDVITTSDGNTLPLPVITAHAASDTVAANADITAADAAGTTIDLSVSKYGYITKVPTELVQDATFDLDGYLARAAGRELGRRISLVAHNAATAGFTVTGATAASATVGATGSVFSDAIITLFHSVLPEYRSSSAFVMSDPTAAGVRKTKDPQGRYLWETALVNGNPDLILGKGVYVDPFLQGPSVGTAKIIYFGDWSALKVRIAGGIRFERSSEFAFGNDQISFRALVRVGAVTVDPNAVKCLQLTAS